jgi:5-methylcytosine-specific restriction endonuclease McrA
MTGPPRIRVPRIYPPRIAPPMSPPIIEATPTDYAAYLQTEHWQGQREAALDRAHHACQVCNTASRVGRLHVHHRTYERLWHERPDDLTVLCDGCHTLFHDHGHLA